MGVLRIAMGERKGGGGRVVGTFFQLTHNVMFDFFEDFLSRKKKGQVTTNGDCLNMTMITRDAFFLMLADPGFKLPEVCHRGLLPKMYQSAFRSDAILVCTCVKQDVQVDWYIEMPNLDRKWALTCDSSRLDTKEQKLILTVHGSKETHEWKLDPILRLVHGQKLDYKLWAKRGYEKVHDALRDGMNSTEFTWSDVYACTSLVYSADIDRLHSLVNELLLKDGWKIEVGAIDDGSDVSISKVSM
jgi:hypothetical protein